MSEKVKAFLNNGGKKKTLQWGSWIVAILMAAFWAFVLYKYADFDNEKWMFFINSWVPMVGPRLFIMYASLFFIEWMTDGQTINSITDVTKECSWQKIAVAAAFYLGFVYLAVWCCIAGPTGA
jgi:hypothetical protein